MNWQEKATLVFSLNQSTTYLCITSTIVIILIINPKNWHGVEHYRSCSSRPRPMSLGVSSGNAVVLLCWCRCWCEVVIGLANVFYSVSRSLQLRPIRGVYVCSEYWPMRGFLFQTINYEPFMTSRWQIFGRYSRFHQQGQFLSNLYSSVRMHMKQPLKTSKAFPVIKLINNYIQAFIKLLNYLGVWFSYLS